MQYRDSSFEEGVFETYWFEKNIQGDIVAVYDENGVMQISYTYDAWGNFQTEFHDECTYSDPVAQNPFLYRGYYYDAELEMYYLQSRYYDPMVGRFINADAYVTTGQGLLGNNMYMYCLNNPACRVDDQGYISVKAAKRKIKNNAKYIKAAAKEFGVDPAIVAGCIYAEQVLNVDLIDSLFDLPCSFLDTSIGIGQVKVSTAAKLQELGYIEKSSRFIGFSAGLPMYYPLSHELANNKTNIRYVAAYLKMWQDVWADTLNISCMPAILGTLYNLGDRASAPNKCPKPNPFGRYVSANYYMLKKLIN